MNALNDELDKRKDKMPAHNRRFGTMAGVTPQKISWELGRLYPA